MALLANETEFNNYLSAVRLKTTVHECPSIHRQERDIAYQIKHNGEFVTIGRYTPPTEYLVFDYLGIYKQNYKINTTKRQNVNVS